MTRKDYELIAGVIRECEANYTTNDAMKRDLAKRFALAISIVEPNFNGVLFIQRCLESSNEQLLADLGLTATDALREQVKAAELEHRQCRDQV